MNGVGALEEVVDDLDLFGPGAEARERVDQPLQPVVRLDDLLGRALLERVRLVVEHERAGPFAPRRRGARAAARRRARTRTAARAPLPSVAIAPGELGARSTRRRRRSIRASSSPVTSGYQLRTTDTSGSAGDAGRPPRGDGVRRRRFPSPSARRLAEPRHAARAGRDALGVVAVRAALEERERRVREPSNPVERRHRHRHELGQPVARGAGAVGSSANSASWPSSLDCNRRGLDRRRARSTRTRTRLAALELDAVPRRSSLSSSRDSTQPIGVSRSRLLGRSRRRRSAGRRRASSRRSRGEAVRRGRRPARPPHLLVVEHATLLARARIDDAEPEAAVGPHEDLLARRRPPVSRPASATTTTLNSRPFAA